MQPRALLSDIGTIKSSNSAVEKRYIVKTELELGGKYWLIELALSDRSDINYLMLLGRQSMENQVIVDPSKIFMLESNDD